MKQIDKSLCIGCAACTTVCDETAIRMESGKAVCNNDCNDCDKCIAICPVGAIK